MKHDRYRQCGLTRGTFKTVSWIPEKFAVEGKWLRLKGIDGWRVDFVGSTLKDGDEVRLRSRDYREQRKASDV